MALESMRRAYAKDFPIGLPLLSFLRRETLALCAIT